MKGGHKHGMADYTGDSVSNTLNRLAGSVYLVHER